VPDVVVTERDGGFAVEPINVSMRTREDGGRPVPLGLDSH
jgi:hypothetical protein